MKQYTPEELNKLSKEEIVALLMQSQKEAALFKGMETEILYLNGDLDPEL